MRADPRCPETGLLKITLPASERGQWAIRKFRIDKDEAKLHRAKERLRAAILGGPVRPVVAGRYTKLCQTSERFNEGIWMSDTPAECEDHLAPVVRAVGSVLINGLGLGLVLKNVLAKSVVSRVVVVERERDVIELVGTHYADSRLEIVHADAFEYEPRERFDVVWHDIWAYLDEKNLPQMAALKLKYETYAEWQGCWSEPDVVPRLTHKPNRGDVEQIIRSIGPVAFRAALIEFGIDELRTEIAVASHFGRPMFVVDLSGGGEKENA